MTHALSRHIVLRELKDDAMAKQRNLKVSVENFGPVKGGEFELKPLTIFIGANNSGKSYMALLVYAFSQALSGRLHGPFPQSILRGGSAKDIEKYSKELEAWLPSAYLSEKLDREYVLFRDLPQNIQQILQVGLEKNLPALRADLEEAIRDYFGCEDLQELIRGEDPPQTLSIRLNGGNAEPPFLSFQLKPRGKTAIVQWAKLEMTPFHIPLSQMMRSFPLRAEGVKDWRWILTVNLQAILWTRLLEANGISSKDAYYLPSARSGILQGWQVLASMALQIVRRRLGLERIDVPPLTGVAGDFLQVLWERLLPRPRSRQASKMRPALEMLEGQVFRGEVSVEGRRQEQPRMVYKFGTLQLPLQRASSMVGELAPLDLWIKYLLHPGDLLIIDEPEAHLHPENQRSIAKVLVRLVRAGVRVLCTTHSSLILHQVSNHLLASEAIPKVRAKLGFTEDDLLRDEEVSVYLFDMQDDGTHIKSIPVEPGFGISEDEFVKVAEAIGDETYRLSVQPARRGRKKSR